MKRMQGGILTPTIIGAKGDWPRFMAVVYSPHAMANGDESLC
jgi:hypothetical protein